MKPAEKNILPAQEAAEAVKAYLRMHRGQIADDAELLALLLPERFPEAGNVRDYQHFIIEKLRSENAKLKSERDGLKKLSDSASAIREGVRALVLELVSARSFEDVVAVATSAAKALGADRVSLAIESADALALPGMEGVRLLPLGLADSLIGRDAIGAILRGGHEPLFAGALGALQSVAIFRIDLGPTAPPALFAVGAIDAERFEDECETREIAHFVRALERAIVAWLDLPKN